MCVPRAREGEVRPRLGTRRSAVRVRRGCAAVVAVVVAIVAWLVWSVWSEFRAIGAADAPRTVTLAELADLATVDFPPSASLIQSRYCQTFLVQVACVTAIMSVDPDELQVWMDSPPLRDHWSRAASSEIEKTMRLWPQHEFWPAEDNPLRAMMRHPLWARHVHATSSRSLMYVELRLDADADTHQYDDYDIGDPQRYMVRARWARFIVSRDRRVIYVCLGA